MAMDRWLVLMLAAACQLATAATNYYVRTDGSNGNTGLANTPGGAFATVQKAADEVGPGDTVFIADGTYNGTVGVYTNGDPTSYIVFMSINRWGAKLVSNSGSNGFTIGANYVEVNGIELTNPGGHGFNCERHHHVRVIDCHAHHCGNSGISGGFSDFYHFEGNVCDSNASLSWYSGISIYEAASIGDGSPGFHTIIRGNICYGNFQNGAPFTDGNGIIIDDWNYTQNSGTPFPYEALVENNLCYDNGGAGIKTCWSDNITVRNNICYKNNTDNKNTGTYRGDYYCQSSRNNTWVNNIGWADPAINRDNTAMMDKGNVSGNSSVANIWANNIFYDGTTQLSVATGDGSSPTLTANFTANPLFVAPGISGTADFHLQSSSPAVDTGTAAYGLPERDLDGAARVSGRSVDLGCYEVVQAATHRGWLVMATRPRVASTLGITVMSMDGRVVLRGSVVPGGGNATDSRFGSRRAAGQYGVLQHQGNGSRGCTVRTW